MLGVDDSVSFKENTHQYFYKDSREFRSVTRVLNSLRVPFDKEGVSRRMALSAVKSGSLLSVDQEQSKILESWDNTWKEGVGRGEFIHDGIENFLKNGKRDESISFVLDQIRDIIKPYYRFYSEAVLYDIDSMIAGMTDITGQRQKTDNSLYDFWDVKTNKSHGIDFDSISRKNGDIKHYNRMLLPPVDHLEDCTYNVDCLQLSFYGYLAETTYGVKVGRLGIIFIDQDLKCTIYPVPYLRDEVISIIKWRENQRSIIQKGFEDIVVNGGTIIDDDDWTKPSI